METSVRASIALIAMIVLGVACSARPANEYGIPRFLEQLLIEDAVASLAADQVSELRLTAKSVTYVGLGQWGERLITTTSVEGSKPPSMEEMWPREDLVPVGGITYDVGKGLQPWAETVVCYYVTITVAGQQSPTYIPGIAYGKELEEGRRWKWRYDTAVGEWAWQHDSCPDAYPIENTD